MNGRFAGFFLGNSLFDDAKAFPPLPHCRNDAFDLFEALTTEPTGLFDPALSRCHFNLSKPHCLEAIDAFFEPIRKGDTVLMYFASHGRSIGKNHFALAMQNTKENNLSGSAFDVSSLNPYFAEKQIRSSILIFDCCRAGRVFDAGLRHRGITNEMNLEALTGMGKWLIASCHDYENAHELETLKHGVFTHYIIYGIRSGNANPNTEDEYIAVHDVCTFASAQMRSKHNELAQDPIFTGEDLKGQPVIIARNPLFKPTASPARLLTEAMYRIYSPADLSDSAQFELRRREKLSFFIDQLPTDPPGTWRRTAISLYGEALGLSDDVLREHVADAEARLRFETATHVPAIEPPSSTARGFAGLFSAGARELAFALHDRGSNFGFEFQHALEGAAADARGVVTIETAFNYVRRRLEESPVMEGRTQRPELYLADDSMKDFVLTGQSHTLHSEQGRRRALLLATDTYLQKELAPLPREEALMSRMSEILSSTGAFDVQMLLGRDVTRANLLDALYHLAQTSDTHDTLLLYFAGYGTVGDGNSLQLILFDSDYQKRHTLVSARDLANLIRPRDNQKNVLILDTSHAGAAVRAFQ